MMSHIELSASRHISVMTYLKLMWYKLPCATWHAIFQLWRTVKTVTDIFAAQNNYQKHLETDVKQEEKGYKYCVEKKLKQLNIISDRRQKMFLKRNTFLFIYLFCSAKVVCVNLASLSILHGVTYK